MRKRTYILLAILIAIFFGRFIIDAARFSPVFFQLAFNRTIELRKADHMVNVLLLGIGGGSHEGPNLTDTVIFASIDPSKKKVSLVSIPRDLWITDISGKINTAYAIGEEKQKGGGKILAKAAVSKIVGQPIDYLVVINFDGFAQAVDLAGGLDITVDSAFDDYQYPVEDKKEDLCGNTLEEATQKIATLEATLVFPCRYQHVHFDKGKTHMDGKQALIFVRSRYAVGEEGTDFARSRRQQKVIQSFKDKLLSLGILLNPIKLTKLYGIVSESIDTDIEESEFDDFIKLANKMKNPSIQSFVLEAQDNESKKPGLLINPLLKDFNGIWVLVPRKGDNDFSEIHAYIACITAGKECPIK